MGAGLVHGQASSSGGAGHALIFADHAVKVSNFKVCSFFWKAAGAHNLQPLFLSLHALLVACKDL